MNTRSVVDEVIAVGRDIQVAEVARYRRCCRSALWATLGVHLSEVCFFKKIRKTDGKTSVLLFTIHGIIFREKVILVNCQPLT